MINNITDISSSVVRVTWTRPDVLNGILISYTITYVTDGPPTDMIVDYNQQEVSCLYITCSGVIMSYYRHSFMILWDLIHINWSL